MGGFKYRTAALHVRSYLMSLKILQYNVWKSKDRVMAPLLADPRIQDFDIIALQEPWTNRYKDTTYCPRAAPFFLAYPPEKGRCCFLINKKLDISTWEPSFTSPDLGSLQIQAGGRRIWVHNVYSQPPKSHSDISSPTPIPMLTNLLEQEGEHIVLGDFNLHHPLWCGIRNPTAHKVADQLIDILHSHELNLTLPHGSITRRIKGEESTIDLVFMDPILQNKVVECQVRQDLDHGSDHLPIFTEIALAPVEAPLRQQRSWKRMDLEVVEAGVQDLRLPTQLDSKEAIDQYTKYLTSFTQGLIEKAVPWAKPSEKAVPWWNLEIGQAVQLERQARRNWGRSGLEQDWKEWQAAGKAKRKLIIQAKRQSFREAIHEAAENGDGIWKLAKWGRTKAQKPNELPIMPTLVTEQGHTASTIMEKAEFLRARFYPTIEADLTDIEDFSFSRESFPLNSIEVDRKATREEVESILKSRKPFKAPGIDGIPNGFLQAMGTEMAEAIARIASACWELGHYPQQFKEARTITLRKPEKPKYSDPGAWRPIALLSTIGKVIETLIAKRIGKAAEENHLLPDTQMGARAGRSTETALELLTRQVHTIWSSKRHVATLLSIDISGAFDTVNPIRLLDILRKKRLPQWIVRWVQDFITTRNTTLVIQGHETPLFPVNAGVPQGSPLSPILFLLYTVELHEICNRPWEGLSGIGFSDDTNLLAYSESTEANCRKLERVHKKILQWAQKHGMKFAPGKYELIHFTRRKGFNLQAGIQIGGVEKAPTEEVRILGIWVDPKLRWSAHWTKVQKKSNTQIGALIRTTASTWGASFLRARQVYSAVVRPAMAYGAAVWHTPAGPNGKVKGVAAKLERIQNKCLRVVAGAYRATPIRSLEIETFTPPIDLHLDSRLAAFQKRLENSEVGRVIENACNWIKARVRNRKGRRITRKIATNGQREAWAKEREERLRQDQPTHRHFTEKQKVLAAWKSRWQAQEATRKEQDVWDQVKRPPDPAILKLHKGLRKAESSVLIQLRTGRTGLRHFLNKVRVPGHESGQCSCGEGLETPRHVLLQCPDESERREALKESQKGELDFIKLLDTPAGAPVASKWMIRSGRIPQFHLAGALLYGENE